MKWLENVGSEGYRIEADKVTMVGFSKAEK